MSRTKKKETIIIIIFHCVFLYDQQILSQSEESKYAFKSNFRTKSSTILLILSFYPAISYSITSATTFRFLIFLLLSKITSIWFLYFIYSIISWGFISFMYNFSSLLRCSLTNYFTLYTISGRIVETFKNRGLGFYKDCDLLEISSKPSPSLKWE